MRDDYKVYIHTNTQNGLKYVGITSQDPEQRWRNGGGYYKNRFFTRAIKKYGWDAFEHEIVAEGLTKLQAEKLEKKLIRKYKTTDRRYGYNIMTGGGSTGKHSTETRRLMSENRKGKCVGRKHTEEEIRKMRENHGGGVQPKRVICLDTGEIYESINAAAVATGVDRMGISKCCHGKEGRRKACGFRWRFIEGDGNVVI